MSLGMGIQLVRAKSDVADGQILALLTFVSEKGESHFALDKATLLQLRKIIDDGVDELDRAIKKSGDSHDETRQ